MDAAEVLENALLCYEDWSGLSVTVHDLDGRMLPHLDPAVCIHCRGPCAAVKFSPAHLRCEDFEVHRLRPEIDRWPDGRIHRCHAGRVECVVPIRDGERVTGILFAGQGRAGDGLVLDVDEYDDRTAPPAELPTIDGDRGKFLLEGLRQLAARLAQWLRDRPAAEAVPANRATRIRDFVARHHAEDIALDDLARHLGLSHGRTAHVVREATGRRWTELLTAARLRSAADLLRHSDLPVLDVALRSGWGDLAHFHRVFKARLGITPARYRRDPEAGGSTTKSTKDTKEGMLGE